jgi:hypothetical protein
MWFALLVVVVYRSMIFHMTIIFASDSPNGNHMIRLTAAPSDGTPTMAIEKEHPHNAGGAITH